MITYKVYFRLTANKEMSMIAINESSDDHLIFDDHYSGVNAWRSIPTHAVLNLLSTADGSWNCAYSPHNDFGTGLFVLSMIESKFLKISKDQTPEQIKGALKKISKLFV